MLRDNQCFSPSASSWNQNAAFMFSRKENKLKASVKRYEGSAEKKKKRNINPRKEKEKWGAAGLVS